MPDVLSELNDAIGYETYVHPATVVNGFHVFFRNYLPSYDNDFLVGVALAWRSSYDAEEIYACIARESDAHVIQYEKGQVLDLQPTATLPHGCDLACRSGYIRRMVEMKKTAMDTLLSYVSSL